MSIKRISAVWDHSKSTGNDRLLMLALADAANDLGFCWPGYDIIQRKMACKSRGSVTNAIKRQEAKGELFVDHRQQRGNRYIVLVGLSDGEIADAMLIHFAMNGAEIQVAIQDINEKRNKSKKQTNSKSPKNRPQKVRKIDRISLENRLDPSLTVIEPSSATLTGDGGAAALPALRTPFQLVQDYIVDQWFQGNATMYGRAGKLAHVVCGTSTAKGYAEYNVQPGMDVAELSRFVVAYLSDKKPGFNLPESPEALNKEIFNWRKKHARIQAPVPTSELSPEALLERAMYGGAS